MTNRPLLFFSIVILLFSSCGRKENPKLDLSTGFQNPPHEARPRTWMHAMSGNMSKEGLTKDLEAMADVSLGGFLLFNIAQGIPNGPVEYNSPEHHEMLVHAAKEAERLGLDFGVHNCDGWSSSGGPWVTPEMAMKMVVWSEKVIEGGAVETQLEQPTTREGFYRDIAVLAYPSLETEIDDAENQPIIAVSDKKVATKSINDGKIEGETILNIVNGQNPWVQFSYQEPKTIRSAKAIFSDRHAEAMLQRSDDGIDFSDVQNLYKVRTSKNEWAVNDHFEPVTAKFFRIQFNQKVALKEAALSAVYQIENLLGRSAIARTESHDLNPIGASGLITAIEQENIKNLTDKTSSNGILKTDLPQGKWTILRFGITPTGAFNHPASDAGRGLEVDKLSREAFKIHYDAFLAKVKTNTQAIGKNTLKFAEIDSYEMGGQNWTRGFDSIFEARKNYDIINFLPLVAGKFIDDSETSEGVLWDYRDVISDLMKENYFEYFTELAHRDSIITYVEPYGFGPLNDLDVGGTTDIPMGEFWMNRPINRVQSAVSSAHIYGKPIVSAESFTSRPEINWAGHPAIAKTSGDLAWTTGINEFMFHRFAHQANTHVRPGMTMNRWGFHFDRTQTWWYNAGKAWFDYIARGSYLLRQGNPVSDVLVFVGDGSPNSVFMRDDFEPGIPNTINFDNVNADVLIHRVSVEDGNIKLPEGTTYHALYLKNSEVLTLVTAKRLAELAEAGVAIYGEIPRKLAGYTHGEMVLTDFQDIVAKLKKNIKPLNDWEKDLAELGIKPDFEVVDRDDIPYTHRRTETEDIYFFFNPDSVAQNFKTNFRVSNKIPELWDPMDGSITDLAQFSSADGITTAIVPLHAGQAMFVVFRKDASGMKKIAPSANSSALKYTYVGDALMVEANAEGQYGIQLSDGTHTSIEVKDLPEPIEIKGNWQVAFQEPDMYDKEVVFDSLVDWKDHPVDSINYYSGTATYKKTINVPKEMLKKGQKILLDLGTVSIVAGVVVNGKNAGVLWMPPFVTEITKYLQPGSNTLEIKVTNQWSNKLIGDERFAPREDHFELEGNFPKAMMPQWYVANEPLTGTKRTSFSTAAFYMKGDTLLSSGLIGPVILRTTRALNIQ